MAHWVGEIYEGKHLHEPINVILVDAGGSRSRAMLPAVAMVGLRPRGGGAA